MMVKFQNQRNRITPLNTPCPMFCAQERVHTCMMHSATTQTACAMLLGTVPYYSHTYSAILFPYIQCHTIPSSCTGTQWYQSKVVTVQNIHLLFTQCGHTPCPQIASIHDIVANCLSSKAKRDLSSHNYKKHISPEGSVP